MRLNAVTTVAAIIHYEGIDDDGKTIYLHFNAPHIFLSLYGKFYRIKYILLNQSLKQVLKNANKKLFPQNFPYISTWFNFDLIKAFHAAKWGNLLTCWWGYDYLMPVKKILMRSEREKKCHNQSCKHWRLIMKLLIFFLNDFCVCRFKIA